MERQVRCWAKSFQLLIEEAGRVESEQEFEKVEVICPGGVWMVFSKRTADVGPAISKRTGYDGRLLE